MAIPSKVEWDETTGAWGPARNRPGADVAEWNGREWVLSKNPEGPGAVRRGLATGWESTKGLALDVVPAMVQSAFGYEEAAQKNLAAYKKRMDELAAKNLLARTTYEDVKNLSSLGSYVGEAVGEAIPSLASSLVGGLGLGAAATRMGAGRLLSDQVTKRAAALEAEAAITGQTLSREAAIKAAATEVNRNVGQAVGVVGASALQNIPESFASLAAEGQQSLGAALVVGSLKSALDAVGPIRLLSKTRGTDFSDKLTDIVSARLLKGRPGVAGALGGTLETLALEGLTEGAQELLDQTASTILADKSINWKEVVDAALKGGIGAAPIGGAVGAFGARARAEAEATRASLLEGVRQKAATEEERVRQKAATEEEASIYGAARLAGEVEEPAAPPKTPLQFTKEAAAEVTNKYGQLPISIAEEKDGTLKVVPDPRGVIKLAQQQVQEGKLADDGKPYTVSSLVKKLRADISQDTLDVADRLQEEARISATSFRPTALTPPGVVQDRAFKLEQAQRLLNEVQQDPAILESPGVRAQFEEARSLLREAADEELAARQQERELGPLVGQPFGGTPGEIPRAPARSLEVAEVAPEQAGAPTLGRAATKEVEDLLMQVPPGGQVSVAGIQSALQKVGTPLSKGETLEVLRQYAPAKNITQAGLRKVPPTLYLKEKDGVFSKPPGGEVREPFRTEAPELGRARARAETFEGVVPATEIISPTREVLGGPQNLPPFMDAQTWAATANRLRELGPSKNLTYKDLDRAAGQTMTQGQRAALWDSFRAQGVVKGSPLSPRVAPGEVIGRVSPEVVGGPTMRVPTPVEEPSGVPFMLTQKMRVDLFTAGLTREQIAKMSPQEALTYLANRKQADILISDISSPEVGSADVKGMANSMLSRMRRQEAATKKAIPDDYSCG